MRRNRRPVYGLRLLPIFLLFLSLLASSAGDHSMQIKIVKDGLFNSGTEQVLPEHLKRNFPLDMEFSFEYVPEIPPQVSGKYQMVVNAMAGRQTR